jgi:hypothetical protein
MGWTKLFIPLGNDCGGVAVQIPEIAIRPGISPFDGQYLGSRRTDCKVKCRVLFDSDRTQKLFAQGAYAQAI